MGPTAGGYQGSKDTRLANKACVPSRVPGCPRRLVSQPILQVMVGLGCRGGCVDAGQWEGAAAEALNPSPVPKATQGRIAQARGSPDRGQTSVPSPGQAALDTAGSRLASPNLSWGCASQGGVVHRGTEARWERPPRLGQDNHQRLDRPPVPPSSQRWDRPPVCLYRHSWVCHLSDLESHSEHVPPSHPHVPATPSRVPCASSAHRAPTAVL